MDKQEILNKLKIVLDHTYLRLPEYIDFTIDNNVLNVHIGINKRKNKMSCLANMQEDEAAFEGWCICLKYHLKSYFDKVKFSWAVPINISEKEIGHYNRFLYRVLRFRQLFSWFEVSCEHENILVKFESSIRNLSINSPEKQPGIPLSTEISEKKIEYNSQNLEFLKSKLDLKHSNHQLPVGVFKYGKCFFTGGASALDIWGTDDKKNLHLFELKYENKKVGIITELLFYCEVFYDVFITGKIGKPKNINFLRDAEFLYSVRADKVSRLKAYFLIDEIHSLVEGTANLLNENSMGIKFFTLFYKLNGSNSQFEKLYFKGAYQIAQQNVQSIFRKENGVAGNKFFLSECYDNFFNQIRRDVVQYFDINNIEWWSYNKKSDKPTDHMLSSQIQCLNFLYAIRKDKNAVLQLAKLFEPQIDDIYPAITDKDEGFLAFEFTCNNDKLINERSNGARRGKFCTSIDVFLIAKQNDKKLLVPIEWKYTESYLLFENKALEKSKGQTRQASCNQLISESKQLKTPIILAKSIYYFEPYYELMRQTLLVEQMVSKGVADDFLHIFVAPDANTDLLQNSYLCEQQDLVETWKNQLEKPEKFKQIDTSQILGLIARLPNYSGLYNYLKSRYI
jgi:hypothetical protein